MSEFEVMQHGGNQGKTILAKKLVEAYESGKKAGDKSGRISMRDEIVLLIRPLLDRDNTLQKLVSRIQEKM